VVEARWSESRFVAIESIAGHEMIKRCAGRDTSLSA
jgi:hypothetical protein